MTLERREGGRRPRRPASAAQGTEEERFAVFRRVQDEIRDWIWRWLDEGAG